LARISRILPLLILCGLALPFSTAAPGESVTQLGEVDVIGKSLRDLEHEAVKAEDRFYKRFNALNTNDDFDIHCKMDKETGTNIPKRQCRVQFLVNAGSRSGQEFQHGLISAAAAPGVNTPLAWLVPEWVERSAEYRQTVKALLEKDPELMALGAEWVRRQEQYERARKQRQ
jgi:hypothetical protein